MKVVWNESYIDDLIQVIAHFENFTLYVERNDCGYESNFFYYTSGRIKFMKHKLQSKDLESAKEEALKSLKQYFNKWSKMFNNYV